MRRLVAAPDKFKGTASATAIAEAIVRAGASRGWRCDAAPMADGGEGLLDALGGSTRHAMVSDPLGRPVDAIWAVDNRTAVVEMAKASGLTLVGGREHNDALAASTKGTGELIAAAIIAGARRVIVGVGGSATTDGGLGAVEALQDAHLAGVELVVACDVKTTFVDAARVFGPQKGATPSQVAMLTKRLEALAGRYRERYGVDVTAVPGSGAAGGLAGGLAALGATLVSGFDLVSDIVGLAELIEGSDLVVTGEGRLDPPSLAGKVVGGVIGLSGAAGVSVLVVAGEVDSETALPAGAGALSLIERYGRPRAMADPVGCVEDAVAAALDDLPPRSR